MAFLDRLQDSLLRLWEYVPALFGAAVVMVAGFLVARFAQRTIHRLLRRVHLNEALQKGGVAPPLDPYGVPLTPSRVIGNVVFWFLIFTAMLIAADTLGIDYLGQAFAELVSYVPSVIAAVVIVILGLVLGDLVAALIAASAGALAGASTLARVGKGGVVLLAVFMSLQELGVATGIVTTAFAIIFGAIALALALSFGLGNRELAGEVTRRWYEDWRHERETLRKASEQAEGEHPSAEPR
ncbi:mechanosensitive ion channel [Pseudogemmatithrix spongiicola]|uniref:Mechanosensitive ion channel n=1 Tax=Pseudogemmatithrix spongiicola TaxID=3062599 RepID=A0AA49Q7C4_9BACT|nr:mechanosensitive ion channel [Gemmatimonadaceae bacterium 'strain 138']WKW13935.1 mechanosensitive ion channel [Gemmatimonadaceae bacterium 'strain 318']